jgi:hypothetical protein
VHISSQISPIQIPRLFYPPTVNFTQTHQQQQQQQHQQPTLNQTTNLCTPQQTDPVPYVVSPYVSVPVPMFSPIPSRPGVGVGVGVVPVPGVGVDIDIVPVPPSPSSSLSSKARDPKYKLYKSPLSSPLYDDKNKGTSCHQCKNTKSLKKLLFCGNLFNKRTKPEKRNCRKKYW